MQDRKRIVHSVAFRLFCLGLLLIIPVISPAQKIPFVNYTVQNGLPQNTVNDIAQDHNGYIWFATQVGAARFDGYEFEFFNTSRGLPDNSVNCILADSRGRVWMGTENGIAILDGGRLTTINVNDGLVDKHVDGLVEDLDGNIWASSAYGISMINNDTVRFYSRANALPDNLILDVLVDRQNRVHVATRWGVTVFEGPDNHRIILDGPPVRDILETASGEIWYATQDTGIFVYGAAGAVELENREGLTNDQVLSLMQDRRGRIWCGTFKHGVFRYENEVFTRFPLAEDEPIVAEMFQDSRDRIWILTFEDGIWLIDGDRVQHLNTSNNLAHDHVVDILEDRYGSIWLATLQGASRYGRVVFEVYDMDFGLPDNSVYSVFHDSRGRVWFGTYGHLLVNNGRSVSLIGEKLGFPGDAVPLCFLEDHYRNIHIGSDRRLDIYGGRSIRELIPKDNRLDDNINDMIFIDGGHLWCATDSGIVRIMDSTIKGVLGERDGLAHRQVNALAADGERVYCATEGGLSVFDLEGSHLFNLTSADGLVSDVCIDIILDRDGDVWIATNRGLSRIARSGNDGVTNYTLENGLTSNTTYFVEFADSVSLWIGTERGIDVLHTGTGEVVFYGYEEGFHPLETNARAISRGKDGELWIGTIGGLVHYLPRHDQVNTVPPDLILMPPRIDGEIYEAGDYQPGRSSGEKPDHPVLPFKKNTLEFRYTGIHTLIPSRNRFSYYLEGFDDEWSEPALERSVSYRKLPSGSYTFRVRAFNLDGIPVEEESRFAFTINPPFWRRAWFILLEVLAGLSLLYGIIKYRERQLIREKRILEKKVKERTREIEDQKVEIEAQRDEISEQKHYVEIQRDQIALQNKEITDSIHYAKSIQQAVLPGRRTLQRILPGHFILFRPRDIVSGDFFWVEEKEERIVVCVADCTGHGVPGAFMSMLGLTFLNEIVSKDAVLNAGEILNRLRSSIIQALSHKEESSDTRDGMDVALIVIDPAIRTLEYAGAYNPLLIMRNGEMIEFRGDKMPIGRHVGEERPFTGHRVSIQEGDMIYLFSDGFRDQFGGESGGKFKALPFKGLLQRISPEPVEMQLKILEDELDRWMGPNDQVDDILVMGIRFTSPGSEK